MRPNSDYDYTTSGFDSFLSRSVDEAGQVNLDSVGPVSNLMRMDSMQMSGAMGDSFNVGKIRLNGTAGNITINDGSNDFLLMGQEV